MRNYLKKCGHCLQEFNTSRRHTKFCSDYCRVTSNRDSKSGRNPDKQNPTPIINERAEDVEISFAEKMRLQREEILNSRKKEKK